VVAEAPVVLPSDLPHGTKIDPSLTVVAEPTDRKSNLQSLDASGVFAGAGGRHRKLLVELFDGCGDENGKPACTE
jgi:hypothetical protein